MGRKKNQANEYVEMHGLLGNGKDYHVYHMTKADYIIAWATGFAAGFAVLYAFFNSIPRYN